MTLSYIRSLVKRHNPSLEHFVETIKKGKTYKVKFYKNREYYALVNSVSFVASCNNLGLEVFRNDDFKEVTIHEK